MAELFFGEHRFDTRGLVLEGPAGSVEVRPKTLQLLTYLIEHRNRFVSHDELLDSLWPDVTVTRASLTQAVSELRQALGDDPREPRFIETRIKLGYRFIAPVYHRPTEQLELLPPPPGVGPEVPAGRRTRLAAAVAAGVVLVLVVIVLLWPTGGDGPLAVAVLADGPDDGSAAAVRALEEVSGAVLELLRQRGVPLADGSGGSHTLSLSCRELPGLTLEIEIRLENARDGTRLWGWTWLMPTTGDPREQARTAAPRIADSVAAALGIRRD